MIQISGRKRAQSSLVPGSAGLRAGIRSNWGVGRDHLAPLGDAARVTSLAAHLHAYRSPKRRRKTRSWRWCLGRVSVRKRTPRLSGLADVHSHNRSAARGTVYTYHVLCIAWPQAYLTLRRSSAPPKVGRSSPPPSPISIPGLCWLCPLETSTQSNKGCWLGIPRVNLSCLSPVNIPIT